MTNKSFNDVFVVVLFNSSSITIIMIDLFSLLSFLYVLDACLKLLEEVVYDMNLDVLQKRRV